MSFPLFDTLYCQSTSETMKVKEMVQLATDINNLDIQSKELVYVLIMFYTKKDKLENTLPYEGDMDTLTWSISKLPHKLKNMLRRYVSVRQEETKREQEVKEMTTKLTTSVISPHKK